MNVQSCQLTVYFEESFWIGVFERKDGEQLFVYKHTFGSETKDYEILTLINTNFSRLKFSQIYEETKTHQKKVNFKKMQKKINKTLENSNRTKSQQIIQAQKEQNKLVRKRQSKMEREKIKKEKFDLKQEKQKRKHKGH
jgi:DNA polymerase III delta prime subunit